MELSLQRNPRMRRTEKISLEDYVNFTDSCKQFDLTVNQLNQVIEMHGFKKIHKKPKQVLIDAVNSIDIMDPSRSTLEDNNISSCAFITLEEAINDLADLNWQECCVNSIQTLNSVKYDLVLQNADTSKPNAKSRSRRKIRKLKQVETRVTSPATVTGDGSESCGGDVGGLQSACSSAIVEYGMVKLKPRKMKKNERNDGGFGATVGGVVGGLQSACSSAIIEYGAMKLKPRKKKKNVRNDGDFGATIGGFGSSSSTFVSVGQC